MARLNALKGARNFTFLIEWSQSFSPGGKWQCQEWIYQPQPRREHGRVHGWRCVGAKACDFASKGQPPRKFLPNSCPIQIVPRKKYYKARWGQNIWNEGKGEKRKKWTLESPLWKDWKERQNHPQIFNLGRGYYYYCVTSSEFQLSAYCVPRRTKVYTFGLSEEYIHILWGKCCYQLIL